MHKDYVYNHSRVLIFVASCNCRVGTSVTNLSHCVSSTSLSFKASVNAHLIPVLSSGKLMQLENFKRKYCSAWNFHLTELVLSRVEKVHLALVKTWLVYHRLLMLSFVEGLTKSVSLTLLRECTKVLECSSHNKMPEIDFNFRIILLNYLTL